MAGVFGDHRGLPEDLHAPGQSADLDLLTDKTERHAVLPPFETDETVDPALTADDHVK